MSFLERFLLGKVKSAQMQEPAVTAARDPETPSSKADLEPDEFGAVDDADTTALIAAFTRAGRAGLPEFDAAGRVLLDALESKRDPQSAMGSLVCAIVAVEDEPWAPAAYYALLRTQTMEAWRATSALHAALYPRFPSDDDPVGRVTELHEEAVNAAAAGDEALAVAIWRGLIPIGDSRVTEVIGACWRHLSSEGRFALSQNFSLRAYAGVIFWLTEWLSECEGGEMSHVASTLCQIAGQAQTDSVVDVHRRLPEPEPKAPGHITVTQRWTREGFGVLIKDRLLRAAADEEPPCLLHTVLTAWGITHTDRWPSTIMRTPTVTEARALMPLLPPEARLASSLFPLIPLADADFEASSGKLLLSWLIFNPNGPTWSTLGVLPTEDADTSILFYRMLNPFVQESYAVATLLREHRDDTGVIGRCVQRIFTRNRLELIDGSSTQLVGAALPTSFVTHATDLFQFMSSGMMHSSHVRELNAEMPARMMAQFPNDPWERTRQEREIGLSLLINQAEVRGQGGSSSDEQMHAYFLQACAIEHCRAELTCLPASWHGAIDHAAEPWTYEAYNFWRLEDFLARYGFAVFRQ